MLDKTRHGRSHGKLASACEHHWQHRLAAMCLGSLWFWSISISSHACHSFCFRPRRTRFWSAAATCPCSCHPSSWNGAVRPSALSRYCVRRPATSARLYNSTEQQRTKHSARISFIATEICEPKAHCCHNFDTNSGWHDQPLNQVCKSGTHNRHLRRGSPNSLHLTYVDVSKKPTWTLQIFQAYLGNHFMFWREGLLNGLKGLNVMGTWIHRYKKQEQSKPSSKDHLGLAWLAHIVTKERDVGRLQPSSCRLQESSDLLHFQPPSVNMHCCRCGNLSRYFENISRPAARPKERINSGFQTSRWSHPRRYWLNSRKKTPIQS